MYGVAKQWLAGFPEFARRAVRIVVLHTQVGLALTTMEGLPCILTGVIAIVPVVACWQDSRSLTTETRLLWIERPLERLKLTGRQVGFFRYGSPAVEREGGRLLGREVQWVQLQQALFLQELLS